MRPTVIDLERRRPVWDALSDLYLDTEAGPSDHRWVCDVILESGYTDDEIEYILRRELGPVLGGNLLSDAGEWAGFDQEWLVEAILQRRSSWRRFLPCFTAYRMIRHDWNAIRRLLAEQRSGSSTPAVTG